MKKVLIALDYDPTAQKVAEAGYSFAKAMNAEVFLVHVIAAPAYYVSRDYSTIMGFTGFIDAGPVQMDNGEELRKVAQAYLHGSAKHLGEPNLKILVMEGGFAESILEAAKEIHADIIVVGSHGQKWLENILIGSVTEKVLQHTTLPLFIVPTKKHKTT
ncbi:MAG: universal stress protein [Bacteroidales bacterium]|jgi:nucleotide-binding universal stress UspA family protein